MHAGEGQGRPRPGGAGRLLLALATLSALAAAPASLRAQSPRAGPARWAVDFGAGLGIPGAVINEELDPGPAGRIGV
ncbi:MAG TPA: hypothetical protein VKA44_02440, partial [Gemmatimonadota bacterium]|nr:hypothetical protein [Gemmatimonadota bacterium]